MAISSSSVGEWLHRTDLSSHYADWALLVDEMLKGEPRRPTDAQLTGLRISITRATGSLSTSNPYISKPSDFLQAYAFNLTADSIPLRYFPPDVLRDSFRTGTGRPRMWSAADVILFDVLPDSAYAYELAYYNATTAAQAITSAPQVYLAAMLHIAFDYIGDDENASKWLGRYKIYAHNENSAFKNSLYSGGAIAASVDGSTP